MAGISKTIHRLTALLLYLLTSVLVFNAINAVTATFSPAGSGRGFISWLSHFRADLHLIPLLMVLEAFPAAALGWRLMKRPNPRLQHFILAGVLAAAIPPLLLARTLAGAILVLFILPAIPVAGAAGAVIAWSYLSYLSKPDSLPTQGTFESS